YNATVRRSLIVVVLTGVALAAVFALTAPAGTHRKTAKPSAGIHKIRHVIVIMQENRSFDHYFGTYPGAAGFPRTADDEFAVCAPDPAKDAWQKPYHDTSDLNAGGPHGALNATADIAGGKMDGFFAQAEFGSRAGCIKNPNDPLCSRRSEKPDVMGYHDGQDIP